MNTSILPISRCEPSISADSVIARPCYEALMPDQLPPQTRCVYIHGAAGYGKSAALTYLYYQLLQDSSCQTAWLTLDRKEGDTRLFLFAICQCLQRQCHGLGAATEALLMASSEIDLSTVIDVLSNELHSHQQPINLFIDRLEIIKGSDSAMLMSSLLLNNQYSFRLFAAGRGMLPPSFEALRASGMALCTGPENLRLSEQEALHYLNKVYDIPASSDEVAGLLQSTDAWPLAINIYASKYKTSSVRKRLSLSYDAINPELLSYFEHNIMPAIEPALQTRLLELALCHSIDPALLDQLYNDASATIQQLVDNEWLVDQAKDSSYYRFHRPLHQYLRSKVDQIPEQRRVQFHKSARDWFNAKEHYVDAIYHAIEISDWASTIDIIDRFRLDIMTHNQLPLVWQWISRIPIEVLRQRPRIELMLSWHHGIQRNPRQSLQHLNNIREEDRGKLVLSEDHEDYIELASLKAVITVNQGLYSEILELCEESTRYKLNDNGIFANVYTTALVYAFAQLGELDTAHRLAVRVENFHTESNVLSSIYRFVFRGMAYRFACQLGAAEHQHLRAIEMAQDMTGDERARFSVPEAMLLEIYYLRDELALADQYRPILDQLEHESVIAEPVISGYAALANIAFLRGHHNKALDTLARGESYGREKHCDKTIAHMLYLRCLLLLNLGDTKSAKGLLVELQVLEQKSQNADLCESKDLWFDVGFCRSLALTAIEQHEGEIRDSVKLLQTYANAATKNRRQFALLQIRMYEAVNYAIDGKPQTARKKMLQALSLASDSGIVRVFLDSGKQIKALLIDVLRHWDSVKQHLDQPINEDYIAQLKQTLAIPDIKSLSETVDDHVADQLNARDLALLNYLGDGLKNRDIAEVMSLSENTIAWHLKNLYAKLNARNRTSAVSLARKLKLID